MREAITPSRWICGKINVPSRDGRAVSCMSRLRPLRVAQGSRPVNKPLSIVGRPAADPLIRLFDGSALVGLTDGELLARFVATRDEAAFEGLVARLGPMVLGVARRMLGDRGDADDAFQATFLVLVRRARSVGRGDLIGPWLHGVAVRVCRKARAQASRRQARERTGVSVDLLPPGSRLTVAPDLLDGAELQATIDDEIARLPAGSRRLVILCDVEGLTRDEAADRLGWTPHMVRGRLARARTRLRANLARRGCLPPGLVTPATEASGLVALSAIFSPPAPLVAATARAALATLTPLGRSTVLATGLATTSAQHLAEGVIRAMFLTSWKFVGASVIMAGALAAGTTGVLVAQGPAPANPPGAQKTETEAKSAPASLPPADASLRTLLEERLRSAQKRYETQNAFYEEGRITIDRLIDASRQVMEAELALADTSEKRRASMQTHIDRVQRIHSRETRELEVGRATAADLACAADALIEARILLAREDSRFYTDAQLVPYGPFTPRNRPGEQTEYDVNVSYPIDFSRKRKKSEPSASQKPEANPKPAPALPSPSSDTMKTLQQARLASARQRYEAQQASYNEGRITIDRLIDASRQWMQAERALENTPEKQRAIVQTHFDRLKQIQNKVLAELEVGRAMTADVYEVSDAVYEAQILLERTQGSDLVEASDNPQVVGERRTVAPARNTDQAPRPAESKVVAEPKQIRQANAPIAAAMVAELNQARVELARKLFEEASRLYPSELSEPDYIQAQRDLFEAELAAATTPEGRAAACQALIAVAEKTVKTTEDLLQLSRRKPSDVMRARVFLLEIQARAAGDGDDAAQVTADLDRRMTEVERKVDRILDLLNSLPDRAKVKR